MRRSDDVGAALFICAAADPSDQLAPPFRRALHRL